MSKFARFSGFTALCLMLALLATGRADAAAGRDPFPEPDSMRSAVAFWMRVYLEATTSGGLLHDARNLGIVYETVQLSGRAGSRAREHEVNARRAYWRGVLNSLASGHPPRDERERALWRVFKTELGHDPSPRDFAASAQQIRFQLGQRDKFRAGLIRSGAYEDEMRAIFREMDLPEDLAFLPHVESSFDMRAYSKYGAAGVWQFMRGTGRRYLTVNYTVDERLDPMRASEAAARLLRDNYRILGSWPLAVTAYNHGAGGMQRAVRTLGTDNIGEIVRRYHSRSFGFASRNFYAQFLAARRVVRSYEAFFGPLERDKPQPVDEITLPFFADVRDIENYLGVSTSTIQHHNPALRPPAFKSGKRIPKGYTLRVPAGTSGADARAWLAAIPRDRQHVDQQRSNFYKVERGDTLGGIARRQGTDIPTLVAVNNLDSRHRIYPGQVLQLPGAENAPAERGFELVKTAQAATLEPEVASPPAGIAPAAAPAQPAGVQDSSAAAPDDPVAEAPVSPEAIEEQAAAEEAGDAAADEPLMNETVGEDTDTAEPLADEPTDEGIPDAPADEPLVEAPVDDQPSAAEAEAQDAGAEPTPEPEPSASDAAAPSSAPDAAPPADAKAATLTPPPLANDSRFRRIESSYVVVDASETLGHFSEWLEVPTQRLRQLNKLSARRQLRLGQRLKLDFSKVSAEQFQQRRMEYHKAIEEDFFGSYTITGTVEHELRKGESLWLLSHKMYSAPTWLLHRYNPDLDLNSLTPGTKLNIPLVEKKS